MPQRVCQIGKIFCFFFQKEALSCCLSVSINAAWYHTGFRMVMTNSNLTQAVYIWAEPGPTGGLHGWTSVKPSTGTFVAYTKGSKPDLSVLTVEFELSLTSPDSAQGTMNFRGKKCSAPEQINILRTRPSL